MCGFKSLIQAYDAFKNENIFAIIILVLKFTSMDVREKLELNEVGHLDWIQLFQFFSLDYQVLVTQNFICL